MVVYDATFVLPFHRQSVFTNRDWFFWVVFGLITTHYIPAVNIRWFLPVAPASKLNNPRYLVKSMFEQWQCSAWVSDLSPHSQEDTWFLFKYCKRFVYVPVWQCVCPVWALLCYTRQFNCHRRTDCLYCLAHRMQFHVHLVALFSAVRLQIKVTVVFKYFMVSTSFFLAPLGFYNL